MGDLNKFPVYGAIGKMDAPCGLTGSVNPFTNSTMWHAFGGLAYGAQVSLKTSGLHATFMAVQGGSQFRGLQTSVDSTNVPSRLNNFVGDISYTFDFDEKVDIKVGGSYMEEVVIVMCILCSILIPVKKIIQPILLISMLILLIRFN